MDSRTSEVYRNMIASIEYPNIHLVYVDVSQEKMPLSHECFSNLVAQNIAPGHYDLITTRIDNDDTFHMDTVRVIHDWYGPRPVRWTIVFAFGYLLDLSAKQIFLMQYWNNNYPTMIERSIGPRSVYFTGHTRLVADAAVTIGDEPYWIQVVHSENVANDTSDSGSRTVYRDKPVNIANLSGFNIDIDVAGLQNIELQTARRK